MSETTLDPGGAPADWLDAYLDGALSADQRAQFEAELARNADLRAELDLARRISGSLRRRFEPEPVPVPASAQPAKASPNPGWSFGRRLSLYAGIAAAVLVASGAYVWFREETARQPFMSADALLAKLESNNFTPEWVCKDDEEFAGAVTNRLGQPLLVASGLPGVNVLGWAYASPYEGSPISDRTMVLMTAIDGEHAIVLMDHRTRDRQVKVPTSSGLRVFRREVGELVAYEVTPLDHPRVLDGLYDPRTK